jgi:hypothetical protein
LNPGFQIRRRRTAGEPSSTITASRERDEASCRHRSPQAADAAPGITCDSAPACGWFTEGFDTRGLTKAKAMLDVPV